MSHLLFFIITVFIITTNDVLGNNMKFSSTRKYENMLIFINDNVPEGDGSLLRNIQNYFKSASRALYKATSNLNESSLTTGVQFGNIYIKVPQNWNLATPGISNIKPITWQQCNRADFFVSLSSIGNKNIFTKQLRNCGDPAEFIKFAYKFFLETNSNSMSDLELKKMGKIIVSEFARLRYGVFPETPYRGQLTFYNGTGFSNSTCSQNIKWKISKSINECTDEDSGCTYEILPNQNFNSSIMFEQSTDSNEYFCNNDTRPHNNQAETLHNIKCNRKSMSDIILQHSDFNSRSFTRTSYSDPTFTIVKGMPRRIVLLLDVSQSMTKFMQNMKDAAVGFIKDIVENDAEVSVVDFSTYAYIRSPLTSMRSQNNRGIVADVLRRLQTVYWTNLPAGLRTAVQALGGNIMDNNEVYGTIILLSDGGNNQEHANYEPYLQQIVKKRITVNVIGYGTGTDARLSKLTSDTGGKFLFASMYGPNVVLQLKTKFSARHSCELKINQTEILIQKNKEVNITGDIVDVDLDHIDAYMGTNVKLNFNIKQNNQKKFTLIDPNEKKINPNVSPEGDIFFQLSNSFTPGLYKLRIESKKRNRVKRSSENSLSFQYSVTSVNNGTNTRKISPTGSISTSDITMVQPNTTVLALVDLTDCGINDTDEIVNIKLTMKKENTFLKSYEMKDNGKGDDSIKNDKIFSKGIYSKDLLKSGFYNFDAVVNIMSNLTDEIITRSIDLGSLRVHNDFVMSVMPDKIKPAQIEKITMKSASKETKEIEFEFKAVGNDSMDGNITKYEFKITSGDRITFFNKTISAQPNEVVQTSLNLARAVPPGIKKFSIEARGIDDAGNKGDWSMIKYSSWDEQEIKQRYRIICEDKDPGFCAGVSYEDCADDNIVSDCQKTCFGCGVCEDNRADCYHYAYNCANLRDDLCRKTCNRC